MAVYYEIPKHLGRVKTMPFGFILDDGSEMGLWYRDIYEGHDPEGRHAYVEDDEVRFIYDDFTYASTAEGKNPLPQPIKNALEAFQQACRNTIETLEEYPHSTYNHCYLYFIYEEAPYCLFAGSLGLFKRFPHSAEEHFAIHFSDKAIEAVKRFVDPMHMNFVFCDLPC